MTETQSRAERYCGYIQPDHRCTIMEGLTKETDPTCKYWREQPERCRYLELHILGGRR